jgi:uncharacterized BrkB/YihY/UPF0761 family membrane protein
MWSSAFVVLFGAEINAEAERQTRQATTTDPVAAKIQSQK